MQSIDKKDNILGKACKLESRVSGSKLLRQGSFLTQLYSEKKLEIPEIATWEVGDHFFWIL